MCVIPTTIVWCVTAAEFQVDAYSARFARKKKLSGYSFDFQQRFDFARKMYAKK